MSDAQKVIKYCAIAFAFFLIFSIITGIMYGVMTFSNLFDEDTKFSKEIIDLEKLGNVAVLEIDLRNTNLVIQTGSELKAMTDSKYVEIKQKENKLLVVEKKHHFQMKQNRQTVTVSIPETLLFDEVSIDTGAGKMEIASLTTKKLSLDLGAGNVIIQNLKVENEADIDAGAGRLQIVNGSIHDLDLDMGVGEFILNAKLSGYNKIDAGVGAVTLNLFGDETDYRLKADKGIGSIRLNQEEMKGDVYYGTGSNIIEIDGGVGSIQIQYLKELMEESE